MKQFIKAIFLLVLFLYLAGCSLFESNTSLMSPPALPDAEEKILSALNQYVSSSAELLTPLNGEQSKSIILEDLDGDGEEEAIVFYKEGTGTIKGIVLAKKDKWEKVTEISGEGKYLYDLVFFDMNEDGQKEIFMGTSYSKTEEGSRVLFVYDIKKEPVLLLEESYSYFLVDQFGSTGSALGLIKFQRGTENLLSLYKMKDNNLSVIDGLKLDPYINGYVTLNSGKITPNEWGMMLDVGVGAHSGRTFIISVKKGKLKNVFSDEENESANEEDPTFKASIVGSEDTNQDGILEYAVLEDPVAADYSHADMPYITVFYQLDEKREPQVVSKAFYNYTFGYKISIPLEWPAVKIKKTDDWKHVEMIQGDNEMVLFDVYVSEMKRMDHWEKLEETDDYVYLSKTVTNENKHLFQLIDIVE